MLRHAALFAALLCTSPQIAPAQHAADPTTRYYRLICLVHLTGSGRHNDAIRAEFLPEVLDRGGILSWSMQLTDDKHMAIVHLVAANRTAFDAILNDKRSDIRVFEIGKHGRNAIETELRKYKRDFDLDQFQVVAR